MVRNGVELSTKPVAYRPLRYRMCSLYRVRYVHSASARVGPACKHIAYVMYIVMQNIVMQNVFFNYYNHIDYVLYIHSCLQNYIHNIFYIEI